jgi:hypothetical protein
MTVPIALWAAVLSTQPGFIPIRAEPLSGAVLLIILEVVTWLLLDLFGDNRCFRKALEIYMKMFAPVTSRRECPRNIDPEQATDPAAQRYTGLS